MAEIHTRDTDIAYVLQGSATLVTGGTALGVKATGAGGAARERHPGRRHPPARARRRRRHPQRHAALVQGSRGALPLLRREGAPGRPAGGHGGGPMNRRLLSAAAFALALRARERVVSGRDGRAGGPSCRGRGSSHRRRRPRWSRRNGATATSASSTVEHHDPGPDLRAVGAPEPDQRHHAAGRQAADFDDSGWETIAPAALEQRRSNGRLAFNWYRTRIDPAGESRRPRRPRVHRRLSSWWSTTTPRSGWTAGCRWCSARPAASSSRGSTRPIAWC